MRLKSSMPIPQSQCIGESSFEKDSPVTTPVSYIEIQSSTAVRAHEYARALFSDSSVTPPLASGGLDVDMNDLKGLLDMDSFPGFIDNDGLELSDISRAPTPKTPINITDMECLINNYGWLCLSGTSIYNIIRCLSPREDRSYLSETDILDEAFIQSSSDHNSLNESLSEPVCINGIILKLSYMDSLSSLMCYLDIIVNDLYIDTIRNNIENIELMKSSGARALIPMSDIKAILTGYKRTDCLDYSLLKKALVPEKEKFEYIISCLKGDVIRGILPQN